MKKLSKIFGKMIPTYFKKPSIQLEMEDDYEMEEYHNPFLGIYCYEEI
jgi:hypothetical protein